MICLLTFPSIPCFLNSSSLVFSPPRNFPGISSPSFQKISAAVCQLRDPSWRAAKTLGSFDSFALGTVSPDLSDTLLLSFFLFPHLFCISFSLSSSFFDPTYWALDKRVAAACPRASPTRHRLAPHDSLSRLKLEPCSSVCSETFKLPDLALFSSPLFLS